MSNSRRCNILWPGADKELMVHPIAACSETKRVTVYRNYSWLVAGFHPAGHVTL